MSASVKRRSRRAPQDSLRPGWMLNSILFCMLLASIGACYVWLGVKYRDREIQIAKDLREIKDFQNQMEENELRINRSLSPEDLRARTARAGLELKPIEISSRGRFFRLPDPAAARINAVSPVLAGNLQP